MDKADTNSENYEGLRYSRQIILDGFGAEGQDKLKKAKILVAGSGGLGSPALLYLAAAGVGNIGVVDFDTVTISNLNRQVLHFTSDMGRKKTDSAEEKLYKLNPEVKVIKYNTRIHIDNVEDIISGYDVVIDATDNFTARYLISDCCYFMKKPLVEGAAVGLDGILMTIIPDETPCYRCLYPYPPEDGVLPTCSDVGILGAVTGVVGSMQALEAIKFITGMGQNITGRILTFDALASSFREVKWARRESCPLCGKEPKITELVQYKVKCRLKGIEVSEK
ncbi:HesA/MoeB/ThiF family protein [Pseudobacteroides cellulosolvens]|uniref:UBA/THIF-type NAD/FAD binding protein n=1 Tax=Pseudobacteroides cellulosolvens ATCC 35603 = DSM 2933 TaxID=398512 RepID=A0A0L6JVX2_9FIRM|nr:HesA/MoeB/ThiF family protein [Pseudobacteroides cellulosolvens]KNY29983.1 UBA/THIF-type NAD/FAD binding protein [Pseudobacteroides cellulosolvens ATCC 35603 = DSM 2933]